MTRALVQVRALDPYSADDADELTTLWLAAREEMRAGRPESLQEQGALRAVRTALQHDGVTAFVVRFEGVAVGYLILTCGRLLPMVETSSVSIEHLFVLPEARRRGLARALLSTATSYAEQVGAEQVATSTPAGARESNRFFARLGFTPFVLRRVVSVPQLRRRLAAATCEEGSAARRVEDVLTKRRSLRAAHQALRARATSV